MSCDLYKEITNKCTVDTAFGVSYGLYVHLETPDGTRVKLQYVFSQVGVQAPYYFGCDNKYKAVLMDGNTCIRIYEREVPTYRPVLGDRVSLIDRCESFERGDEFFDGVVVAIAECGDRVLVFNPKACEGHSGCGFASKEGRPIPGFNKAHWEIPSGLLIKEC